MNTDILDKFTTHLKNVLTSALAATVESQKSIIEPIHLLWALTNQKGSIANELLNKAKVPEPIFELSEKQNATKKTNETSKAALPKLSAASKRVIEKAVLTANIYEHKYIGTEHLLAGLLQINDAEIKNFFEKNSVDVKTLRQQLTLVLKSTSKFPEITNSLGAIGDESMMMGHDTVREKKRSKKQASKTPALDFFSTDLTKPEVQAGIDPVIGREEEIERVMQILCRRTKNNPILLGDPGVGKTALVEGLAKKISKGEVPDVLQGKRLLALDLTLIVSGTMYRGEFEGRLKQVIDEVKANPDIILFIDEVHTIIGAGSSSGSMDAANILKPALARGEIRCIGATTPAEYKKHFESDAALERRFQAVMINEPNAEKTVKILMGIKKNYEDYHNVTITKDAIETAVNLAERYLQDKFFPDKAIDLIDEAASSLRVKQKPSIIQKKIRKIEEDLAEVRQEKQIAVNEERFIEAISIKEKERDLEEDLRKILSKNKKTRSSGAGKITSQNITEIISRMTGIPVHELIDSEKERLINLEETLSKKILGQTQAVKTVADFVRRSKTGISHPNRPLASFMFVGPSGVGKTELAKVLAEEVFQDKNALIQLDMSEFSEGFTVTKLLGAPAGYVGYKDSAKLTDGVKKKPYSVVLFDELEKAHPDILNLLLQILDAGHITDATGKKINFKNTIIIMTSNIGSDSTQKSSLGFSSGSSETSNASNNISQSLRERFRPEFLNRIDRICVFETLDKPTLHKIIDNYIDELNGRLDVQNLKVVLSEDVKNWIIEKGASAEHGARAIRRVIQDYLENQLANLLLECRHSQMKVVRFILVDDEPKIKD